ncbi:MAG: class II aldolase/adducin family protein [Leucobacter sp.]
MSQEPVTTPPALMECVEASRRLGGDPFLTLHGGGNTSTKTDDTLWVKASGFNLGTIVPQGFAPLDRTYLDELLSHDSMSDTQLVETLRAALLDPKSKDPSIEAPLHHLLPYTSVLHSHADAIVALTNTAQGLPLVEKVLGDDLLIVGFTMAGFELAKTVDAALKKRGDQPVTGIVLANHGLFTFGDTAEEALARHLELVGAAADYIQQETGVRLEEDTDEVRFSLEEPGDASADELRRMSEIQAEIKSRTGADWAVQVLQSDDVREFIAREDLARVSQVGTASLEHVIHTKRVPMIDGDFAAYEAAYRDYFDRNAPRSVDDVTMLDPVPRVILDQDLGLITTGRDEKAARIANDIYRHTMRIITAAELLGGYRSVTEEQAFDVEYWELEQRKLR